ncbi:MAG TPA: hypothetical protein VK168_04500 [Saprospiraceae bacterium]|nr:hypothetical protein [Saprospiraceae bacterium]
MKIPSMKLRFSLRDAGYLTVIGLLIAWIWMERQRQAAYQELLCQDFHNAGTPIERQLTLLNGEIQKNAAEQDDSLARVSRDLLHKYMRLPEPLIRQISMYKQQCWAGDMEHLHRFNKTLSALEWQQLETLAQAYLDSLSLEEDNASMARFVLGLDYTRSFWNIAKRTSSMETGVILEALLLRVKTAQMVAMNDLAASVQPPMRCFSKWVPVLMPLRPDARVGEMFEADVFLAEMLNSRAAAQNVMVMVNGDTISMDGGAARFQQKYQIPGKKSLQLEIQVRNPLTKTIQHFKKEYCSGAVEISNIQCPISNIQVVRVSGISTFAGMFSPEWRDVDHYHWSGRRRLPGKGADARHPHHLVPSTRDGHWILISRYLARQK